MRPVDINHILGGEVIAKPIIDDEGRVLLSKGITMQLGFINKLVEKGITEIFVEDDISEDLVINNFISEDTKTETKKVIKTEMNRLITNKEVSFAEIHRVIDMLVNDILSTTDGLLNIRAIKMKDDFTYTHTINVTVMSIILAQRLLGDYHKIKTIATGCLLHDFGKVLLPKDIIENYSNLEGNDLVEYQKHPLIGYNMLKENKKISSISRIIVLQHHERNNGSGFPNGLKRDDIHLGAKICGICDEFDLRLSRNKDSSYITTSEAVEYLQSLSGIHFDKEHADILMKNIPVFPEGTVVLINNKLIGIVLKNNKQNLTRPVVRIFYDYVKKKKLKPSEVDLYKQLDMVITRELVINLNELLKS